VLEEQATVWLLVVVDESDSLRVRVADGNTAHVYTSLDLEVTVVTP